MEQLDTKLQPENKEGRNHLRDSCVDWTIILKRNLQERNLRYGFDWSVSEYEPMACLYECGSIELWNL
jgi:hypothetical protein